MTQPSGQQWQEHVASLCCVECRLRGEVYQPLPDKVDGDGGLEGFTTDGEGYQCYADQESVSTKDRVDKQKHKIRTDLNKLHKNQELWKDIFTTCKLKRWFLVTPDVPSKALITHAKKHAKRIREMNLPFVDPAFDAFVVTDDHFQRAKDERAKHAATPLDLKPDDVGPTDLSGVKSDFVENTERKLRQVFPQSKHGTIPQRRDEYLKWYLEHENVQAKLFKHNPEVFERLKNFCSQQQENVKFENTLDDSAAGVRLKAVHKSLVSDLDRDFKTLGQATLSIVARGSVASWLGNCPLEFVQEVTDEPA